MNIITLTEKEHSVLTTIHTGIDGECGEWLHELEFDFPEDTVAGVIGSLVKKGLIICATDSHSTDCHWIELTGEGRVFTGA